MKGIVIGRYQGKDGPAYWGDLNAQFTTFKTGIAQSPIDLNLDTLPKGEMGDIKFIYKDVAPEIINNGHTLQVNCCNGSNMIVSGQQFELLQFHFHSPGENSTNGKHYPMEMHLDHKSDKGELAVVGELFKEGKQSAGLKKPVMKGQLEWDPKTS
ncbi:MAG: carbonic anhydrase family protein [Gammaproteobacteria bacterium]